MDPVHRLYPTKQRTLTGRQFVREILQFLHLLVYLCHTQVGVMWKFPQPRDKSITSHTHTHTHIYIGHRFYCVYKQTVYSASTTLAAYVLSTDGRKDVQDGRTGGQINTEIKNSIGVSHQRSWSAHRKITLKILRL